MLSGGRDVVSRSGLHRGGPDRKAGWVSDDLDVAAESFVLARTPQVVAMLPSIVQTIEGSSEPFRLG